MRAILLTGLLMILAAAPASGAVPTTLTYQGYLTDPTTGEGINDTVVVIAGLYASADGGAALCEETHPAVEVTGGHFAIELGAGACAGLADHLASAAAPHLELTIDGETLAPRVALTSVPYALHAEHAQRAGLADAADDATRVAVVANGSRYAINAVFRATTASLPADLLADAAARGSFDGAGATMGAIQIRDTDPDETMLTGRVAAKRACELAVGSPSARVCTPREMLVTGSLGLPGPAVRAWVETGGVHMFQSLGNNGSYQTDDCRDWTNSEFDPWGSWLLNGPVWRPQGGPTYGIDPCNFAHPIACCDHPE